MVALAIPLPELKKNAESFFEQDELPVELRWVDCLYPRHLRLFAVELADALKQEPTDGGVAITAVIQKWRATAGIDADPKLRQTLLNGPGKREYPSWRPKKNPTK